MQWTRFLDIWLLPVTHTSCRSPVKFKTRPQIPFHPEERTIAIFYHLLHNAYDAVFGSGFVPYCF